MQYHAIMGATNVRERLRQACDAIDAAREAPGATESEEWLSSVRTQLRHFVDGDSDDPEAHVYPPPGAVETMLDRLEEVIERTDDETVEENLEDARAYIQQVWEMLDARLASGGEVRVESSEEE